MVEVIKNKQGNVIGSIEYEKGYGVHARRSGSGQYALFSTSGYHAVAGAGGDCHYMNANKAKADARRWVRGE